METHTRNRNNNSKPVKKQVLQLFFLQKSVAKRNDEGAAVSMIAMSSIMRETKYFFAHMPLNGFLRFQGIEYNKVCIIERTLILKGKLDL